MTGSLLVKNLQFEVDHFSFWDAFRFFLRRTVNDNFKKKLIELKNTLEEKTADLTVLKDLNSEELWDLYTSARRYGSLFDKLADKYDSMNYFGDADLKTTFRSITRNFHKIENISYKLLNEDINTEATPDYIKQGLANFSKETLNEKLFAKK